MLYNSLWSDLIFFISFLLKQFLNKAHNAPVETNTHPINNPVSMQILANWNEIF